MKRSLISIAIIFVVIVMLAGCVSIKISPGSSNTPKPVTPAPTPSPTPVKLTRGIIEGKVYTNESAELMFTAPDGWVYSTDEEFEEIVEAGAEIVGDSKARLSDEAFKEVNIFDMNVTEPETNTGVSVMLQKLTAAEAIYLTEKKYLDLLREGMMKAAVFNYEISDHPDVKIGPNTFKALAVTYTDYGATQYYFVRRTDDYMISVLATIADSDDLDSVMANFTWN